MAADFGTDFAGGSAIDPRMRTATGEELMRDICVRRLSTPRGSLLSNPEAVTLDVRRYLSADYDSQAASLLKANCTSALVDDRRIYSATVTLSPLDPATRTLRMDIHGVGSEGPFSLTVAVSELTVEAIES